MDDELVMRETIAGMLELLGHTVLCRKEGRETIESYLAEVAAGRSITAIILDLTIPGGMGGKEVAAQLRALNCTIPLFVSSGYASDPVMSDPQTYGFMASICKPFRKAELVAMLEKHLAGKG
jgi:two-component system cell cycle sensor histidine kinase/response regulator CckA